MNHDHSKVTYSDSGIPQPWHLVRPSPWPFVGAMVAGLMTGGMVMFMHKAKLGSIDLGIGWPLIGLVGVLGVMFVWWRDIINESSVEHAHSPVVKIGLRYGMALFIASEVMFFSAFFWAYYSAALFPPAALGGVWPPANIETFNPFDMPFIMTLILLLSGTTVTWAHHAVLENNQKAMVKALAITVALGLSFSMCQAYEYHHAEFTIRSGMFGSTFFMATGFHGLHVIIGTIFLAVCLWRAKKGHFTPQSHFGLEAAAWYWHFVDVVWLFLFISIYWYGSK
jgi:cytochrome c oxidase subunit 3